MYFKVHTVRIMQETTIPVVEGHSKKVVLNKHSGVNIHT